MIDLTNSGSFLISILFFFQFFILLMNILILKHQCFHCTMFSYVEMSHLVQMQNSVYYSRSILDQFVNFALGQLSSDHLSSMFMILKINSPHSVFMNHVGKRQKCSVSPYSNCSFFLPDQKNPMLDSVLIPMEILAAMPTMKASTRAG